MSPVGEKALGSRVVKLMGPCLVLFGWVSYLSSIRPRMPYLFFS